MKKLIFILLVVYSSIAKAQMCSCNTDSSLNELIDCSPVIFDNGAKLFWSFSCDSSWLTYENAKKRDILFSMELVNYTGRLGFSYANEYKRYFLIRNDVISGCCSPPEYYLFDKETGKQKANLGRVLFIDTNNNQPIIVKITNSNYTDKTTKYTSITIHNIDTEKKYLILLSANEIDDALKNAREMYPEYLFEEPQLSNQELKLRYIISRQPLKKKTITIKLNKYK